MASERIRIEPGRLRVWNSSGSPRFDTANKYLRTTSSGNLRLYPQIKSAFPRTFSPMGQYWTQAVSSVDLGAHLKTLNIASTFSNSGSATFYYPEFDGNLVVFTRCYGYTDWQYSYDYEGWDYTVDVLANGVKKGDAVISQNHDIYGGMPSQYGGGFDVFTGITRGSVIKIGSAREWRYSDYNGVRELYAKGAGPVVNWTIPANAVWELHCMAYSPDYLSTGLGVTA